LVERGKFVKTPGEEGGWGTISLGLRLGRAIFLNMSLGLEGNWESHVSKTS